MDPVLSELMSPNIPEDLRIFEMMCMGGPWNNYIRYDDVAEINKIVTSARLAGNAPKKLAMIKNIMERNGFRRFAGGTNRVVYRHLEDSSFLAKIAIDKTGMEDNPAEMKVQHLLKPYCTKMYQITPCGTIGFAERVMPLRNIMEFENVAEDIFNIINRRFVGEYILEDIGTKYFMNWGIRQNFGPVLLDYPYVYELDGGKLICNSYVNDILCKGEIDYDDGFNELRCVQCGCRYDAVQLKRYTEDNKIIIIRKGGNQTMNVVLRNTKGEIIAESGVVKESEVIKAEPAKKISSKRNEPQVTLHFEGQPAVSTEVEEVETVNYDDTEATKSSCPVPDRTPKIFYKMISEIPVTEEKGEFCVSESEQVKPGEVVVIDGVNYEIDTPDGEPEGLTTNADISVDGKFIPSDKRYEVVDRESTTNTPAFTPTKEWPTARRRMSMGDY